MIVFDPLWELLRERHISTYDLEYTYGLNPAEINRLKNNHNYTLKSIARLCKLFSCQPKDIILYIESSETVLPDHPQK